MKGSDAGAWPVRAPRSVPVAAFFIGPIVAVALTGAVLAAVRGAGQNRALVATAARAAGSGVSQPAPAGSAAAGAPAIPATTAPVEGTAANAALVQTAPAVAAAGAHRDPSALVTSPAPLTARQLAALSAVKGVAALDVVDAGTVSLLGAPANTIGVDAGSFRNYTPAVTAGADRLWQYVAAGTLTASFDMARDRKLTLGANVAVTAARGGSPSQQWLGAFLSVGLPGVDMVVTSRLSAELGLTPRSGAVLSAPTADPFALETAIKSAVPGASVVLMRPGLALGNGAVGGVTASAAQLSTILTAAVSRVGKPYVWGATGPDGFDCSGLVGWSFAAAGVYLPRTANEQALTGPAVPLNRLQPGDLLFWSYDPANPGYIDHVAIYLGNNTMIEAPQTGSFVHVIPLQTSHLVGAVRVNPAVAVRLGSPWHG